MHIKALKYLTALLISLGAFGAFTHIGIWCWTPLLYAFIAIPVLELFIPANEKNMSAAEEEIAKADKTYDFILYLIVPLQWVSLVLFLNSINDADLTVYDKIGRTLTMGLCCGVLGINVGHELGHRVNRFEQTLAKMLLLTSLYMHFFIEHNKGHHKNVATPEDPSSARFGESVYVFYPRTIFQSYLSSWRIANKDCTKKHGKNIHFGNEMIQVHIIEIAFVVLIYLLFGGWVLFHFLMAACMGILLLETVNYIEHYGLQRKALGNGKFERAMPEHSWNSNHVVGRLVLFELSRHSDHHYLASRKYQLLRNHADAPQMPTGYPGMMLLSLVPPLWFRIMNKKIAEFDAKKSRQSEEMPA